MTSHFNRLLAAAAFTVAVTGMTGCKPANDSVAATAPEATTAQSESKQLPQQSRTILACTKDNRAIRNKVTITGTTPSSLPDSSFMDGFEKKMDEGYGKYTREELKTNDAAFEDVQINGIKYILQFNKLNAPIDLTNVDALPIVDAPDAECVSRTTGTAQATPIKTNTKAPSVNLSNAASDETLWLCTKDNYSVKIYMYAMLAPKVVNGVHVNTTQKFFSGLETALQDVYKKFPKADFEDKMPVSEARNHQAKVLREYLVQAFKNDALEDVDIVDQTMSDEPTDECLRPTTPRITSAAPRL